MTDRVYLDGTQNYHRHRGSVTVWDDQNCPDEPGTATRVHVFDPDALTAHDDAVRRDTAQGEPGPGPLLRDAEGWQWCVLERPTPGFYDPANSRIVAGWDADGVFHAYVSAETITQLFREYTEGGGR